MDSIATVTPVPRSRESNLVFIELVLVITLAWVLVDLWRVFIENFSYGTLGLQRENSYHNFIVALVVTALVVVFLLFSNAVTGQGESGFVEGSDVPLSPPALPTVN